VIEAKNRVFQQYRDLADGFTAREIQRRGWSNLSATGGR
jgi:hypothetical protein